MSKRQKGRRHRRVNRTPRPVGAAVRRRSTAAVPQPAVAHTAAQPAASAARQPVAQKAPEQPMEQAAARPAARSAAVPERAAAERAAPPAAAPGLGRHAARTWESLRTCGAAGASLEELCAAAGYQPRTVTKHVQGLADQGLAELRADRWYAREPAGALAAR
ncbi:hypothetical protein [Streptomyces hiroshimensis]|uniref:HTH iclR-type domain-containing protein n=1 Tax=Streptomyces hiroshimensis TaxID=66424 RepID=A0ABQ2Z4S8_9ACTN|nr:hypothetical protein [Streptomyces hiroshimensis]GGY03253.1 hypothetical protein GCM10010324_57670 [Streptomyces hiroshimensis]